MIEITHDPIDTDKVLKSVGSNQAGASVLFVGTTRQFTDGKETLKLDYECYQEMAIKKMIQIRDLAFEKWSIEKCTLVHRIGRVELGEASIAVAVSTPHRSDSFEAAQWLVDTLKKEVPIWKREHWSDGSQEWVHPEEAIVSAEPAGRKDREIVKTSGDTRRNANGSGVSGKPEP
jgi:molybdopterin synthase catalytic subunit